MPEHWRGDPSRQSAPSKWLRGRWKYGSLKVLDLDCIIISNDFERGLLLEFKDVASGSKSWAMTRNFGERLGFYSGMMIYDTVDPEPCPTCGFQAPGTIEDASLRAILADPKGVILRNEVAVDVAKFDQWVQEKFGE